MAKLAGLHSWSSGDFPLWHLLMPSPVHNDVPLGYRCPVFLKSSPAVFHDELQLGVCWLHQHHLKKQGVSQVFLQWIIFSFVKVLISSIWKRSSIRTKAVYTPKENRCQILHLVANRLSDLPWACLICTISSPVPISALGSSLLGLWLNATVCVLLTM